MEIITNAITKEFGSLAAFDLEALGDPRQLLPAWLWMATHVYDNVGIVLMPTKADCARFIHRDIDAFNQRIKEWLDFGNAEMDEKLLLTPEWIRVYSVPEAEALSETLRSGPFKPPAVAIAGGHDVSVSVVDHFVDFADRFLHVSHFP